MRRFSARDFFSLAPLQNWFKRNEFSFLCIASHHFRVMPVYKCFVKCVLVCWPPPSSSSTATFHRIHLLSNCISISFHSASHNFCKSEKEKCWKKPEIVGKFSVFVCALCILSQLNGKRGIKLHLTLKAKFILLLLPQRKFITTNALRLPCHFAAVVHYFVSIFCMPSFVRIMVGFQWNSDELRCTLCSGHYH